MIKLIIPGVPPTSNNAYLIRIVGGGKGGKGRRFPKKMLTTEGRKYLTETKAYLSRTYPVELTLFKKGAPYGIAFQFAFKQLENMGWPLKTDNRYKRTDVTGRVKLVEDALQEVAGIDDSQHINVILNKCQTAINGHEETRIWAWDITQDGEFPDVVIRALQGM